MWSLKIKNKNTETIKCTTQYDLPVDIENAAIFFFP